MMETESVDRALPIGIHGTRAKSSHRWDKTSVRRLRLGEFNLRERDGGSSLMESS